MQPRTLEDTKKKHGVNHWFFVLAGGVSDPFS
jgi:hypothetical protein